jgi:hypothetical protein
VHSYSVVDQKFGQYKSALDTHEYLPNQEIEPLSPEKSTAVLQNVKSTTALLYRDLSSNIHGFEDSL